MAFDPDCAQVIVRGWHLLSAHALMDREASICLQATYVGRDARRQR